MSRNRFIALSVLLDIVIVGLGYILTFWLRFYLFSHAPLPLNQVTAIPLYLAMMPVVSLFYLVGAWTYGLYDPERSDTAWLVVRGAFASATFGMVVTAALAFFGGPTTGATARTVVLLAWPVQFVLLTGWRVAFLRLGRIRWPQQRVLIIGVGQTSIELATEVANRAKWGWTVSGLVDPDTSACGVTGREIAGFPVLGCAHDIAAIVTETKANRVIVVSPIALRELVESLVVADEARVRVDVVPELYEIFIGTVDAIVGDIPLMNITASTVPRYYRAAKRVVDFVGALLLLVLVSPVLLVAAIAIVATDGFPVVFSQERTGLNLKPFSVYKLRTMVRDAEKLSGPVLAEEDDPRVTAVGRVLRRYRVDELPQLVNILKGEMSFVGPRPERPYFVDEYIKEIPGYRERFRVKPGVTGLAQVSGGYATTPQRKLKYDLIYMFHQDFAMDAQIIVETLRVVLTGRGAR